MSAYSKSGSSDSAAKIRSNTPLSAHRRKRFHTEPPLPKASGRSRQGVPARTTHNTASTNIRLSVPDRPGSPSLPGSRGAIRSHCASVKSNRIKAGLQFSSLESDPQGRGNPPNQTRVNLSHQTECLQTLADSTDREPKDSHRALNRRELPLWAVLALPGAHWRARLR